MSVFNLSGQTIATDVKPAPRQNGYALDMQTVIAHKGGIWGVPLNSVYAFRTAYEKGFYIVEADIQVTSDDIPVIMHDQSINQYARNPDGTTISSTIYVYTHTYQELNQYDYGIQYGAQYAGLKLLTLNDFLTFCRLYGLGAQIDTDSTRDSALKAPLIYDVTKKCNMLEFAMFDCPNRTVAEAYVTLDTNLNIMIQGTESESSVDAVSAQFDGRYKRMIAGTGVTWTPSKSFVDYAHSKGMLVKANLGDGHGGYIDFTPGSVTKEIVKGLFDIGVDFCVSETITPSDVLSVDLT